MQFQNPEILYFLTLLIIPILVHLFQLQKFVKTPFSNVAFLQQIVQQNRKSSRIKKWLILATRILLFLAIVFAFSQPYFSNKKTENKQHTFIYLDNSLSTNSLGSKGNLLPFAAKEIIENASTEDYYSLQTNNNFYEDLTYNELKKNLLNINNTASKAKIKNVLLNIESSNKTKTNTLNKNILISDFQNTYKTEFTNVTTPITAISLKNSTKNNIFIDSVFTSTTNSNNLAINVVINNIGKALENVPIAIYNADKLMSKQTFSISENTTKSLLFEIGKINDFSGKIKITLSDTFLFDNTFYFNLNTSKKINVLSIGNPANFLSKIYTKEEFNYATTSLQNVNYNDLQKQQIIILNELESIPEIFSKSILDFSNNGGTIVVIPNTNLNLKSYNNFLTKIADSKINKIISDTLKVTNINSNHPIFKGVFNKKVNNFQYPIVKSHYPILSKKLSKIVSFENNTAFIASLNSNKNKVYWVASSLSKNNSNFINSPLIVPIFYNFAKQSFQHQKLYYYLNDDHKIDIETQLNKDEILSISGNNLTFIPPQQTYQNKVSISTKNNSLQAGFYSVTRKKDTLQTLAFNTPKEESSLSFLDLGSLQNNQIESSTSIADVFKDLNKKNKVQWLWKWFLALAIVSLLLEIFILKFYKP